MGVKALTIIDYWYRGPKATLIFFLFPLPFLRILKEIEIVYPKKRAKRVGVVKDKMCVLYTGWSKKKFIM